MKNITKLQSFRRKLYELFSKRRDATLELIDALSSNQFAKSVTQLSLSPFFRRQYNSITKVIKNGFHRDRLVNQKGILKRVSGLCEESLNDLNYLLGSLCEPPVSSNFFYLVLIPHRPCAPTLEAC